MKIEIKFRDFREPVTQIDDSYNRIHEIGDSDGGWMYLDFFIQHLREGKFGKEVSVTFKLGEHKWGDDVNDGDFTREYIEYTVVSDDAPADRFVNGLR